MKEVKFVDKSSWLVAIVYLFFLVIFPPAIVAIWTKPQEYPFFISLFCTLLFLISAPFLIKEIMKTSTITVLLTPWDRAILITKKNFRREHSTKKSIDTITAIQFETTDSDAGFFYKVHLVFNDGESVRFVQGSAHKGIREEAELMQKSLQDRGKDVQIVDIRVT